MPSESWLQPVENCNCSNDYLIQLLRKVGARRFVTYAERGADTFYPEDVQDSYIPMTSFFWKSREECIREIQSQIDVEIFEAIPRTQF